jgi:hypothetical protein
MLTLERIGVHAVDLRRTGAPCGQVSGLDCQLRTALAQVQGAIALVTRLASVRAIDPVKAEGLLATLAAVQIEEKRGYGGALADWIQSQLRPALPISSDVEGGVIEAAAAASLGDGAPRVISWEGQKYRFDLVTAEARRVRRIRERQRGRRSTTLSSCTPRRALAAQPVVAHTASRV